MNPKSEKIYLKMPPCGQNILLSLYGLNLKRSRYGGEYKKYSDLIHQHLSADKQQISEYQNQELKYILQIAVREVPYYRKTFSENKVSLNDVQSIADLYKIPFLEKNQIRKDPISLISERHDPRKLLVIHTTGTTGTPLKIYCNDSVRQMNYAFYDRFLDHVGINFKGRRATLGGRIIMHPTMNRAPFWRYSCFQKNLLFSSYHLTDKNIPFYIKALQKFNPDLIDSYPSSLYSIARYMWEHGIDGQGMAAGITTSAETVLPEWREIIEKVFKIKIYDQYGAAEMCVFVAQCPEGSYHIHTDYGILEFIREDGTTAKFGEEAELVCTSLINPVMPLIRYKIGDRGIASDKSCKCGLPFPVIERLLGRIDDFIVTPDGRKIGRLSPVVKNFPLKEVQYIQNDRQSVDILIVKDKGYEINTEKKLIEELRKRLGNVIKINIKYVDLINRGNGGKLRSIISKIN